MATRKDVERVLARAQQDLERPVPIQTNPDGSKSLSADVYQIGITLDATNRLLKELLENGLTD